MVQTCVVACSSLAFAGGFGCYLLSMDSQSFRNAGTIPGNLPEVRAPVLAPYPARPPIPLRFCCPAPCHAGITGAHSAACCSRDSMHVYAPFAPSCILVSCWVFDIDEGVHASMPGKGMYKPAAARIAHAVMLQCATARLLFMNLNRTCTGDGVHGALLWQAGTRSMDLVRTCTSRRWRAWLIARR